MHPVKKFLTEFLDDYLSYSGRLGRNRYSKLIFKAWLPLVVTVFLESLIVDGLELGARFPHTVTFIRVIMFSVTAFAWIAVPCLTARRMRDIGKSGWWAWLLIAVLLSPIPGSWLIGFLLLAWLSYKEGDPDANKYGKPPDDDD